MPRSSSWMESRVIIGSIHLLHANFVKSHLSKKALENCEPQIKVWFFPQSCWPEVASKNNVTPHASPRFCTFQNQRVFNNRSSKYYTVATREVVNHWKNPPEIVITHEHKNHRHLVNEKELEQKQKWLPGFLSFVFDTFFNSPLFDPFFWPLPIF